MAKLVRIMISNTEFIEVPVDDGVPPFSGSYNDLTNKPTIPTELNDLSDLTVSSAVTGQLIYSNGLGWEAGSITAAGVAEALHFHNASQISTGELLDGRVAESNVTQHEAALTITESQISDLSWTLTGTALYPSSTTYQVAIGHSTPADSLDVRGSGNININVSSSDSASSFKATMASGQQGRITFIEDGDAAACAQIRTTKSGGMGFRTGDGAAAPTERLGISATGAIAISSSLTISSQRVPVCFGSLASAPTAQGIGDTYLNSGSGEFFIWDGSSWLQIT